MYHGEGTAATSCGNFLLNDPRVCAKQEPRKRIIIKTKYPLIPGVIIIVGEQGEIIMKCTAMRTLMLRKLDHELSESERKSLDAHLEQCAECAREYALLSLPRRIARTVSPPAPSPYFDQKLRAGIEIEAQSVAVLQTFFGLARRLIPSMAAVTLALLSVFAYFQVHDPQADLHTAYEKMFIGENLPLRMMITEQRNITDESILSAIANRQVRQKADFESE